MSGPLIRRRVFVTGRVQGVGFRASTLGEAARYSGLSGFVRNLEDGRVEALFQGRPEDVLSMVSWCAHGPSTARVESLEVIEEKPASDVASFSLER